LLLVTTGGTPQHRAIESIDRRVEQVADLLTSIDAGAEVERVDREWALEREKYREASDTGGGTLGVLAGVLGSIVVIVFAIVWLASFASSHSGFVTTGPSPSGVPGLERADSVLWGVGILMIVVAIGGAAYAFLRWSSYEEAEDRYQARRSSAIARSERRKSGTRSGSS
jgi:uncharacterized membrane protein YidH (DUF202 family)